jgi:PiT family inorganic phosphate transporter
VRFSCNRAGVARPWRESAGPVSGGTAGGRACRRAGGIIGRDDRSDSKSAACGLATLVLFIVLVALIFDFINGFHDAANSIATVVSTRVLTPLQAVVWAAFFNFVAAFGFGVQVARTVGKGVVDSAIVDQWVILAGLVGAIVWDLITWYRGIPTSSSHALIGGFAGAAVVKAGFGSLIAAGLIKIGIFMILAPLIGLVVGFCMMLATVWTFRKATPGRVDWLFRRLQLLSAAAYSLGHGTNDAQKTMGIIAVLLFSTGYLGGEFYVPFWVVLAAHAAIALGTLSGGWRIVKTMGMRITKLRPVGGFSAETAGAITLIGTAVAGIPVSTTHTITGAIMGVGSLQRFSAVRWGVAGRIVWAWILTIPASALIAAGTWLILRAMSAGLR